MDVAQSEDHVEVEWQFSVFDVRPVARWLANPQPWDYSIRAGATKHLTDVYFDTGDWRLHHAGFTCRVRRKGDAAELTLKSMAAATAGLRSRREVTDLLPPGEEEPGAAQGPARELLTLIAGNSAPRPLFELRTERQTFALEDAAGLLGEIALDVTTIPVGEDVPVRLNRVEVEVTQETEQRARAFVDRLVTALGLVPALTSKFETALVATGLSIPEWPPQMGLDTVTADMTAAEAAFAILRRQFRVMVENEAGTRIGEDPEGLHDMRVATRRMRAALRAFQKYVPRGESFHRELGWVAAALGDVRDLDVQAEALESMLQPSSDAEAAALARIERVLYERRARARRRLLTALDSRRFERMVVRFEAWLRRGPSARYAPGRESIVSAAPDVVERRYRQLRRAAGRIHNAALPSDYHALRIDAKKLRYAVEFVAPLYGRPAADFTARVTALQDLLGMHQDADVAVARLEEMVATARPRFDSATVLVAGALCERYRTRAVRLRSQFPSVYGALDGPELRRLRRAMDDLKRAQTAL